MVSPFTEPGNTILSQTIARELVNSTDEVMRQRRNKALFDLYYGFPPWLVGESRPLDNSTEQVLQQAVRPSSHSDRRSESSSLATAKRPQTASGTLARANRLQSRRSVRSPPSLASSRELKSSRSAPTLDWVSISQGSRSSVKSFR
mmetsp:Transcript_64076/g.149215  ORF Transcript_64076/g.149215 Transcript_64076/m.149215 type:complete len:146 (-) Transcript_64076:56-493(-)